MPTKFLITSPVRSQVLLRCTSAMNFFASVRMRSNDGVLMWGFWAGSHWRGSNAAIVNLNWTLNEAGRRYQALLNEWTTRTNGTTDPAGAFSFRGFHGAYDITVTGAIVPPAVTSSPANRSVYARARTSTTFSVTATGTPPLALACIWSWCSRAAFRPAHR